MKTIKIAGGILFISSLLFSCQADKKNLIDIKIIEKDGLENMTYLPNLEFNEIKDSALFLFDEKDYYRIFTSEIKVAPPIFQNDVIKVRVFTRSQFVENKYEYGFLVRTYSKDGKIKDEMVVASTIGDLSCEGKVTSDLRIVTYCPGGEKTIAQIEKDGAIKILENE
ncbi:hypothetical protein F0365_08485 [Nonlabens sp. Ci31]|jgi:hypothetical protein|uniref:hypothetical protein n=1 Tax=Nonlabens sp. Ci31 TaxID=2608253 RepID=UPI0014628C4D|nr:hypothetical protein [Nonlabens sp. Ci31]QJP34429.1 hypothetical protein F0365_08485 [Nonlabens sp. Ci31]